VAQGFFPFKWVGCGIRMIMDDMEVYV